MIDILFEDELDALALPLCEELAVPVTLGDGVVV
jgi:hypothetical protein